MWEVVGIPLCGEVGGFGAVEPVVEPGMVHTCSSPSSPFSMHAHRTDSHLSRSALWMDNQIRDESGTRWES